LKIIRLTGIVTTGEGSGKKFLCLPWVTQQIEEKLGFIPYLGTLNLRLIGESLKRRKHLDKDETITICPPEGYCVGLVFNAFVGNLCSGIVIPKTSDYPDDLLEVISASYLREVLKLKDGDRITVEVQVNAL
jgi:riboflavin kinase, archaea type